jgi:hypothetical protein
MQKFIMSFLNQESKKEPITIELYFRNQTGYFSAFFPGQHADPLRESKFVNERENSLATYA